MKVILIEGNIGAGKSTRLAQLPERYIKVQEPVNTWSDLKDANGKSVFELFYENQEKYSYCFQMYVLLTRMKHFAESAPPNSDAVYVIERSTWSDHEIFTKLLQKSNLLEDIEYKVYLEWQKFYTKIFMPKVDGIVYLRVDPEVAHERINKRGRHGEEGIKIDYLNQLHEQHEQWLMNCKDCPVLTVDANGPVVVDEIVKFIDGL